MTHLKNVIRDGGGTALLTAYTAHFPYNAHITETTYSVAYVSTSITLLTLPYMALWALEQKAGLD